MWQSSGFTIYSTYNMRYPSYQFREINYKRVKGIYLYFIKKKTFRGYTLCHSPLSAAGKSNTFWENFWSLSPVNIEKTPAFHRDVLIGCKLIMSSPHRWPRQMASSNGLCRYGPRVDCCWGWTRRSWGHCQRECHHACCCCRGANRANKVARFHAGGPRCR